MIPYKKKLLLQYLDFNGASYSYNEMASLFGLQIEQLNKVINELFEDDYLYLKDFIRTTDKAKKEISGLSNQVSGEFEEVDIFTEIKTDQKDIYIPKKFDSKFKKINV